MSDIVDRLRLHGQPPSQWPTYHEAADEIERLRDLIRAHEATIIYVHKRLELAEAVCQVHESLALGPCICAAHEDWRRLVPQ